MYALLINLIVVYFTMCYTHDTDAVYLRQLKFIVKCDCS